MVFPSIRLYLDPPNWQQEPANNNQANGSTDQVLPPLPPQAQDPPPQVGSIMAGSIMADRAQIAKMAPPEATLKCPRCESTNTKFCYFNNYSLSQPRHFCKTCRRYWTRGGALRNVPVGGGCRRNKKSKKGSQGRSKSPAPPEKHSPPLLLPINNSTGATCQELIGRFSSQQPSSNSNRGFMESLQNISRYGTMGQNELVGFHQIGGGGGGVEQWRLQQFPSFLSGFDSATNNNNSGVVSCAASNPFHGGSMVGLGDMMGASSRVTHQIMPPPVKVEGNGNLNLIRSQHMMMSSGSETNQYYPWTDLSGLPSSSNNSAAHLL